MACGVYLIVSSDGRRYVGSAENIEIRWDQHRTQLSTGVHPNEKLQEAWNELGPGEFKFSVLEEVDPWRLEEKEKLYIKKMRPDLNATWATSRRKTREVKLTTTVRLTNTTVELLRRAAWMLSISQSDVMEQALNDFFGKHKIRMRLQLHVTDTSYVLMRMEDGQPPQVLEVSVRNGESPEKKAYMYRVKFSEEVAILYPPTDSTSAVETEK